MWHFCKGIFAHVWPCPCATGWSEIHQWTGCPSQDFPLPTSPIDPDLFTGPGLSSRYSSWSDKSYLALYCLSLPLLGTNLSEWLNIQKRDTPSSGPSFTNSWPSPLPHLPQRTLKAVRVSIILVTLSSLMVLVKAGQGDEWANLERLENSGWLHLEHTYIPGLKWSL